MDRDVLRRLLGLTGGSGDLTQRDRYVFDALSFPGVANGDTVLCPHDGGIGVLAVLVLEAYDVVPGLPVVVRHGQV